ncbi:hypothetical protein MP638_004762 [Amoeboaphelidium occidentale]|nr:hypothetical protein MP638_004762 [Amoeboaphelidium occidentale]
MLKSIILFTPTIFLLASLVSSDCTRTKCELENPIASAPIVILAKVHDTYYNDPKHPETSTVSAVFEPSCVYKCHSNAVRNISHQTILGAKIVADNLCSLDEVKVGQYQLLMLKSMRARNDGSIRARLYAMCEGSGALDANQENISRVFSTLTSREREFMAGKCTPPEKYGIVKAT